MTWIKTAWQPASRLPRAMFTRRDSRALAQALALCAVLFGGLGYGTGNMLQLALDPEGAARAHGLAPAWQPLGDDFALICGDGPASASPLPEAAHQEPLRLLPAHCFFCIDGIAPQPVALATGLPAPDLAALRPVPARVLAAPLVRAPLTDRARGPPRTV